MKKYLVFLSTFLFCFGFQKMVFAQKSQNLYNYPLSVQAYTFRNHFPKGVEATLDMIQKMGFTEIESGGAKGMTNEVYRKLCAERGISIPGTGADFEQLEKDPQAVANEAKSLGATFVMCAWIPHKGDNFTLENAKRAVAVFNNAGKVLKENGLIFCYHTHGFEFRPYERGTLLDYVIENTNPADVSFEMDILWVLHGGGDPVKLLEKYGNRWKLMHLKDLKKGTVGDFSGHTPAENDVVLGTGQADFRKIFEVAHKIGIKHYFIEDESNHELESVPLSVDFLKRFK